MDEGEAPTRGELEAEIARLQDELARRERPPRPIPIEQVAALLRARREAVLHAWEQRVRGDPEVSEASRLSTPVLRDHVPMLYDELVGALEQRSSRRAPADAIGRQVWHSPDAHAHAEGRFEVGYSLGEVLRELSHLRAALVHVLREQGEPLPRDAVLIVQTAIDEAMTVAATEFEHVARAARVESEARYRMLVESVRDGAFFLLDAERRIASWNAGAVRLTGYESREVLGRPTDLLFVDDDRAAGEPERQLAEALATGRYGGRHLRARKDGSVFWADVTISPIHDANGALRGYSELTRDVTAQLQADAALRASEARLAAILASTMDAIVTVDAEQRIVVFNRAAELTFRCPADDARGTSIERFIPERFRGPHAAQVRAFGATGSTTRAMGRLGRLRALRADGEEFPIEATISHVEVGSERLYTVVLRDVSEQARAEAARAEAEARLQGILDNANAFIYVKDAAGRYVLVNRRWEALFVRDRAGVIGRTDHDVFPAAYADRFRANDRAVLERGAAIEATETAPQDDGEHTYVSVKFPLHVGGAIGVGGISTDITERVRARDALAKEVQVRELFMGVLAHDLRVPLNAISMSAAVMLGRDDLDPALVKGVVRIANGARRMAMMVEQLLDVTRARAGTGIPLERHAGDLRAIARQVVGELEQASPDRTIECRFEGHTEGHWDEARIGQVVGNLVTNALLHGRADAPVRVALRGEDGAVELSVHNENAGAPIPVDERARLFDPFERGERRSDRGLGLGLYIVAEIVRAHGGSIDVESDEAGTRFVVVLPRGLRAGAQDGTDPGASR